MALGGTCQATTAPWQAGIRVNKAVSRLESPPLGPRTGTWGGVGRRRGAVSGPGTIMFLREVAVKCGGDRPEHQTRTQAGRGREGAVGAAGQRRPKLKIGHLLLMKRKTEWLGLSLSQVSKTENTRRAYCYSEPRAGEAKMTSAIQM